MPAISPAAGRMEYVAGQTSAGSTAPLWTLLLAAGYRLGISYQVWAWALGALGLALCATLAHRLARLIWPQFKWVGPAVGLAVVAEWHLIWAAGSGMEILLFAALALALIGEVSGSLLAKRRPCPPALVRRRSVSRAAGSHPAGGGSPGRLGHVVAAG